MKEPILFDGANVVQLTDLGITVEAVEDKIIVLMDRYKSGYECSECNGTGKIKVKIGREDVPKDCSICKGSGHLLVIPERAKSLPTSGVIVSVGEKCKAAKIAQMSSLWFYILSAWYKLIGHAQIDANLKITLGARVIFSPHVGTLIPFKGNVSLKIMREHEPIAIMSGADTAARDFIEYDQEF